MKLIFSSILICTVIFLNEADAVIFKEGKIGKVSVTIAEANVLTEKLETNP
jgi:hypothetical protein